MSEQAPGDAGDQNGFTVTRVFEAPRQRIWSEWTEPERFADWFGGSEAVVPIESVTMDVRPGGSWRATMVFGEREIHWKGEYRQVSEPERLVLTITDQPGDERELVTVVLTDLGEGRTEMRVSQQGHMSPEQYERTARGWGKFFDRIDERLAAA
jgi:uncharacterized protein YndB with AHSA1/START domain